MKTTILALLLLPLILIGCGGGDYGQYASNMALSNNGRATMAVSYFEQDAKSTSEILKSLKGNEAAIALLMVIKKDKDAKIIELLAQRDLKAPTTTNDIWMSVANNTIPTVVKWGAGFLMTKEVVSGFETAQAASGIHITGNDNAVTTGSGSIDKSMISEVVSGVETVHADVSPDGIVHHDVETTP